MSRKRRDDAPWEPPEFDEAEFMRKEIFAAKVTIFIILWSVVAALASWGLTLAGVAVVAFFAGLGLLFLLKWILPIVKIPVDEWKRKEWLGYGSTFFFSWLAFWILLLNPPSADLTHPVITGITIDGVNNVGCGGAFIEGNATAAVRVAAADNVGVTRVVAGTIDLSPQSGVWIGDLPDGNYQVRAYDAAGHVSPPCTLIIG